MMLTLAIGNYNKATRSEAGFSLLELLVVLVIVSVIFTGVMFSGAFRQPHRVLGVEAQRLLSVLEQLRFQSLVTRHPHGLLLLTDSYKAVKWHQGQWRESTVVVLEPYTAQDMHITWEGPGQSVGDGEPVWRVTALGIMPSGHFDLQLGDLSKRLSVYPNGEIVAEAVLNKAYVNAK